ncbi:hypothetical protein Exig_1852 [Exiguobacterium sibiricum 255-15]|uniref:DUF2802 domain-containing protein n=1 Tax=Exiguobacterium sibiricum (strain DSM 17290 / CCUG 55495 / CIP 109462 / JCM 13490 / 255-15) TaxID=262543 RepID=B1YI77_EXIS2|nr:hypothetical protein [Exiguobacterium sibiricum]ACB61304.1 hypothetical protein Exig_1852 [Exiguobacterium sibiricum 255-15]
MTLFYILLAALICYGLLLLFKQQALLKDRVTNLERQKQETEAILLQFMQQVNELTDGEEKSRPAAPVQQQSRVEVVLAEESGRPEHPSDLEEPELLDVKDQLEKGADLDQLARSLNRGAGEVALIAKLSRKTKVARR